MEFIYIVLCQMNTIQFPQTTVCVSDCECVCVQYVGVNTIWYMYFCLLHVRNKHIYTCSQLNNRWSTHWPGVYIIYTPRGRKLSTPSMYACYFQSRRNKSQIESNHFKKRDRNNIRVIRPHVYLATDVFVFTSGTFCLHITNMHHARGVYAVRKILA